MSLLIYRTGCSKSFDDLHGLNAKIELIPVMNGEDLQKGLSGVSDTIDRYG